MNETRVSLKRRAKHLLKPVYLRTRHLCARAFFSYGPQELAQTLRQMGLSQGDSVLLHSGFSRDSGFSGAPADVIEILLDIVGCEGHVVMMFMAYRGASETYADSGAVFDVHATPSALGLVSEIFRRRKDVLRSENPLHPLLALGPKAVWLVADHDKLTYSCGRGSPFERFMSLDGKVLFVDAPFSPLTFMHYVEDYFREQLPVPLYEENPVRIRMLDAAGVERNITQFVFGAEARRRRSFPRIERRLIDQGLLTQTKVGNSNLLLVRTRDVFDSANDLLQEGAGFYVSD